MVDCPTEDVPFREGAFGGAGDGIQRARLPFTRTVWFPVWLSPPFPIPKGKPATPLAGCSRLRHWLRPPLRRPDDAGAGFKASTVRSACSFSQGRP